MPSKLADFPWKIFKNKIAFFGALWFLSECSIDWALSKERPMNFYNRCQKSVHSIFKSVYSRVEIFDYDLCMIDSLNIFGIDLILLLFFDSSASVLTIFSKIPFTKVFQIHHKSTCERATCSIINKAQTILHTHIICIYVCIGIGWVRLRAQEEGEKNSKTNNMGLYVVHSQISIVIMSKCGLCACVCVRAVH